MDERGSQSAADEPSEGSFPQLVQKLLGLSDDEPEAGAPDLELGQVIEFLRRQDPDGVRFAKVFRNALDEALDGGRTGRYDIRQLRKVEKTFVGMRVELGVSQAFDLPDGDAMDFSIVGVDVDAKFSFTRGGWQIPPEALGHLCLVMSCSDQRSDFDVGLVRVRRDRLNVGSNRDRKVTLNRAGTASIAWLFHGEQLPINLLLHLDSETLDRLEAVRAGQQRVNALFRLVQHELIPRVAIETVARQTDPAKRARDSRKLTHLGGEGILILGGDYKIYQDAAYGLRLPVPLPGQWMSTRVVEVTSDSTRPKAFLDGAWWAVALADESTARAPVLDHRGPRTS